MGTFDILRDVFKNTKHKKPSRIFCPKCGSPDLAQSSSLNYWLTPQTFLCKKCGYNGPVFMELEENSEQDSEMGSEKGSEGNQVESEENAGKPDV